ncbi:MAG: sensor histidine kinase [Streptosporangiaceae bacterium]|nr:sensor histidine kinase [Streptosporangiaceae bacterium]
MQAVRRFTGGDPGMITDAGMAVVAAGLTAAAAWGPPGLVGTAIVGPSWLRALLPLLMGAPLVLRRRAPLLMWTVIWAGMALLCLLTLDRPHGMQLTRGPGHDPVGVTFALLAAAYSLGAHASPRRAAAALVLAIPVVAEVSHHGGLGLAFSSHDGSPAGVTLAMLQLVAFWLAGVFVRSRRQAVSLAARSAALQRQAEQAAAAERARIARELHDIVAHHLSVVVLHAAGARAAGGADTATLEEIEHSGRQALTETRRLFGVLRDPDVRTGRAPQPGISELPTLVGSLRAAGLEVSLSIDGDHMALPAAVNVSAYRIVQEALTNVLKHAGPARAEVTVDCTDIAVTIEVTDDGAGIPAPPAVQGEGEVRKLFAEGQGLAGMRERVALFGGDLRAGPRPGGGFTVCAWLPIREPA